VAALHIDATPISGPVVHHSAGLNSARPRTGWCTT